MREFCPECSRETSCSVVVRPELFQVGDRQRVVTVWAQVAVCNECGSEIGVSELDDNTLRRAYAAAGWDPDKREWLF